MSKKLIAFIVVCIGFAIVFFVLKRSTTEAFKRVNDSLKRSNAAIDSANKILLDSMAEKLKR
jgi:hypothetical protein